MPLYYVPLQNINFILELTVDIVHIYKIKFLAQLAIGWLNVQPLAVVMNQWSMYVCMHVCMYVCMYHTYVHTYVVSMVYNLI